ncbi:MAG TPA: glycine--tRNA ligase subunit beta [Candidatus Tenderia sp.]|nr:glycine--tRNA ligase subunit beta [Candidatus Tenderia sp.]
MSHRDFLVELGTEELPPKALSRLSRAFTAAVEEGLNKAGLAYAEVHAYAAPRRLAVWVKDLAEAQADKKIERRGPAVKAAFDAEGLPTRALQGFARSCGVEVETLETLETAKGSWLVFRGEEKGQPAQVLLADIVQQALDKLPIPKRMRWGDLTAEFVRPVHWLVLLFGDEVIDAEILAVEAGRETRGHRFHHPDALYLSEPAAYAPLLETEGRVVAHFGDRREAVRAQVEEAAVKLGGRAVIDEALLEEVTGMVEWPVAVAGSFEERFLDVPSEALISAMKGHQKYFHVVDGEGRLMPHFITVSNIDSKDISAVRSGNERVIRPRLSDAEFFWNQDCKRTLADRREDLKTVVFQKELGTVFDKSERIAELAGSIVEQLGGERADGVRAGQLAKCDLMSEMVGEFPELQGIMGRYYARHDGEPEAVAEAMDEQYMPRFAGDELPRGVVGQAVAIADKLDTLVGIFGIGQLPTGSKDPFALRRAALGVLRGIIEQQLALDLAQLIAESVACYGAGGREFDANVAAQVFDFMMERLRVYYQDAGINGDVFEAVQAVSPTRPFDFDQRMRAVNAFRALAESEALAAANKRASNILRQALDGGAQIPTDIDAALLDAPEEKVLAQRIAAVTEAVQPALAAFDYTEALQQMATLRDSVDAFFDQVMVMADDEALRLNRLALLKRLRGLFLNVADVSRLQG